MCAFIWGEPPSSSYYLTCCPSRCPWLVLSYVPTRGSPGLRAEHSHPRPRRISSTVTAACFPIARSLTRHEAPAPIPGVPDSPAWCGGLGARGCYFPGGTSVWPRQRTSSVHARGPIPDPLKQSTGKGWAPLCFTSIPGDERSWGTSVLLGATVCSPSWLEASVSTAETTCSHQSLNVPGHPLVV